MVASPWTTLRFRRSKDVKGWALLGIPQSLYPEVIQSLFEQHARLIEKHGRVGFVNVLFEAPVVLAVRFALAFPAPPGCEPLVVNQAGNRLLYGRSSQSSKARYQLKEGDVRPRLTTLTGEESFWQVVVTFSNIAMALPDDPSEARNIEEAVPESEQAVSVSEEVSVHSWVEQSALKTTSLNLSQCDSKPESAVALPQLASVPGGNSESGETSLDEEGFEEDEWKDEAVVSTPVEVFEDIWDMDEEGDFGDLPLEPEASFCDVVASQAIALPESGLAVPKLSNGINDESVEVVDWGNELDDPVAWDSMMAMPLSVIPAPEAHNVFVSASLEPSIEPVALELAPAELVCLPVLEEEHHHILLQGVAVWNAWRLANPHIRPNLRGAYLNNLDLAGADLHDVDLRCAFLFRANLRSADLSLASLIEADLIRADLAGVSLWGASLNSAYLNHANLAGADLTQADLQGVYWQGAIFTGTIMPNGQLFEEQY